MHRLLDDRVQVHRKQHRQRGKFPRDVGDSGTRVLHVGSPVLPPMHRHQQMPLPDKTASNIMLCARPQLSIDHRIARDHDLLRRHSLPLQGFRSARSRWEVETGDAADHLAQTFLGERSVQVVGSQPRFYVCDRNLVVKA